MRAVVGFCRFVRPSYETNADSLPALSQAGSSSLPSTTIGVLRLGACTTRSLANPPATFIVAASARFLPSCADAGATSQRLSPSYQPTSSDALSAPYVSGSDMRNVSTSQSP